jgi:hypothetical protein
MMSRCITYKRARCLIEAIATESRPDALHVARVYFVDHAKEGDIVRPIIDLDGRPLSILGKSAATATRAARKYLQRLFGAPEAILRQCNLSSATLGPPVTVADWEPDANLAGVYMTFNAHVPGR